MKFRKFSRNISWPVDINMQMSELMMSLPHNFPFIWQVVRRWHHQLTHLYSIYSYRCFQKCSVQICKTSKVNFLIFQPIFIKFSLFFLKFFTLSSEIKLKLFRISPLSFEYVRCGYWWHNPIHFKSETILLIPPNCLKTILIQLLNDHLFNGKISKYLTISSLKGKPSE